MNDQHENEQDPGVRDQEIRAALDQHWAASDANDFETEHRIYQEDAVLEYPQSGERTRGRSNIQNQRASQPSKKRFTIRRIIGGGDLWVTEYILTYDANPSYTVSIMEFRGDKVARETQYFADPFPAPAFRARWVERMDHNLGAREFANGNAICGFQHMYGGKRYGLETVGPVCAAGQQRYWQYQRPITWPILFWPTILEQSLALTSEGVPNGRHKWTERDPARDRACRVEHGLRSQGTDSISKRRTK